MRGLGKAVLMGVVLLSSSFIPANVSHAAAPCNPSSSDSLGVRTLTFTNSTTCTWTVPAYVTSASTILIVGGGGGAGYYGNAGGGGAGALVVTTNFSLTPGNTFDIIAGTGGAGSTAGGGTNGNPSSFGSVTASGGGAGAGGDGTNGNATRFNNGKTGGSGGGGSSYTGALDSTGGTSNASVGISSPWSPFGNSGANGSGNGGGGGGGAGGAGSSYVGGAGKSYFGNVYAKGGSAGQSTNQLIAGSGNGGNVISTGGTGSSGSITIQYNLPVPIFAYSSASPTTTTGVAFANNPISSTGTPIVSYAISPSLPSGVTLDGSSGQLVGTPTTLLSSTAFTVTATDAASATGTTTLTLSITAGPATISINVIAGPVYKGATTNVIVTLNTSGKVRFFANGKRIPNCLAISSVTSGTITATCPWKPTVQVQTKLTATVTPSGNTFTAGSSQGFLVLPIKRVTTR